MPVGGVGVWTENACGGVDRECLWGCGGVGRKCQVEEGGRKCLWGCGQRMPVMIWTKNACGGTCPSTVKWNMFGTV